MASITINTNLASLTAQRNLSQATTGMNTAMERLSTGYRINSGKDDAAGSAVSTRMEAQISGYDVAESNATMGLSLLDTAEGVLGIVGDYLQRIRDLTEEAANGTYSTDSINAIKSEIEARWDEIDIEFLGKDTPKVQFNYYTNGQGNHESFQLRYGR